MSATIRTLTIVIPRTPPPELFPNQARRLNWRVKADISRPLRELSMYVAREVVMKLPHPPIFRGPVHMDVLVSWEKGRYAGNRRMPDLSGLPHAIKAFEDGICDGGIMVDDNQVVDFRIRQEKASDGVGRVTFTVSEVEVEVEVEGGTK